MMRLHGFNADARIRTTDGAEPRVMLLLGGLRMTCTSEEARELADALHDSADTIEEANR